MKTFFKATAQEALERLCCFQEEAESLSRDGFECLAGGSENSGSSAAGPEPEEAPDNPQGPVDSP